VARQVCSRYYSNRLCHTYSSDFWPLTCRSDTEHSTQVWSLDTDGLSAHVGHEAGPRTHYPHVLAVRHAQQVQGLYEGQAVRHLQGQELCNKRFAALYYVPSTRRTCAVCADTGRGIGRNSEDARGRFLRKSGDLLFTRPDDRRHNPTYHGRRPLTGLPSHIVREVSP
jgi:hypothetical protein